MSGLSGIHFNENYVNYVTAFAYKNASAIDENPNLFYFDKASANDNAPFGSYAIIYLSYVNNSSGFAFIKLELNSPLFILKNSPFLLPD